MKIKLMFLAAITVLLAGCSGTTLPAEENDNPNGISPNVISYGNGGDGYSYLVDGNTGVVYLKYNGYYRYGITVMLNADGSPVTAEQLGLEY